MSAGLFLSIPANPPDKADTIVSLGGESGQRSLKVSELYRKGLAPNILLTGLESSEQRTIPLYLHWRAMIFKKADISEKKIFLDDKSRSSMDEARNTLALMEREKWKTVIVVSDPPHMRRLQWTWKKVFRNSGREFILVATSPDWWNPWKWWANETSAVFVVNEYIKLVYYLFNH